MESLEALIKEARDNLTIDELKQEEAEAHLSKIISRAKVDQDIRKGIEDGTISNSSRIKVWSTVVYKIARQQECTEETTRELHDIWNAKED